MAVTKKSHKAPLAKHAGIAAVVASMTPALTGMFAALPPTWQPFMQGALALGGAYLALKETHPEV